MDAAMSLTSIMEMPHLGIKVGVEGLLRGVYCRRPWCGKRHALHMTGRSALGRYLQNLVHRIPSAPFPRLQSRPDITHSVAVGERVVVIEDEGV